MTNATCLQYCINGMGKRLLEFAETQEATKYIDVFKKMMSDRDSQI